MKTKLTHRYRKHTSGNPWGVVRGEGQIKDMGQMQTTVYKIDNQQGYTGEHRDL